MHPESPVVDQVLLILRRITRATDLHSRHLLRRFGITGPQLMVLRAVGRAGELSGSDLARELSVSLPTAADVISRLDSRGLVRRRRSPSDKRQVLVGLTDSGREILNSAPPPLQESFANQLDQLQDWERSQIVSVLERIAVMMEEDARSGELEADRSA